MGGETLTVAGLFAGIGGIELGLHRAGHTTAMLCEIDAGAQRVLQEHFPGVDIASDVREIDALPDVDLVAAGFPCQDLSQAGRTAGIGGRNSGLVDEVFRLVEGASSPPRWLLLENVPFMLQLDRGGAMRYLARRLSDLGFSWAYRVVDTRSFGLPQRRQRVLLLASKDADPREILFHGDAGERDFDADGRACGFYWTEGVRGLGWAVDAIPTLKGGSTIGIPSAPAIRMPDGRIVTPDLRDAERLQGFDADWTATAPSDNARRSQGHRWKLVGNAVSVPVAAWVGERLLDPRPYDGADDPELAPGSPWPKAAWGSGGKVYASPTSPWPTHRPYQHLDEFLDFEPTPLSVKATRGVLTRTERSSLRFPEGFLDDVAAHLDAVTLDAVAA
jgi:DNA (cytosine-5)-methyltransferase 1